MQLLGFSPELSQLHLHLLRRCLQLRCTCAGFLRSGPSPYGALQAALPYVDHILPIITTATVVFGRNLDLRVISLSSRHVLVLIGLTTITKVRLL